MESLKRFEPLFMVIVLLGALNWGIVGLFDTNVLAEIFTGSTVLDVVYVIVGVAGLLYVPRVLEELHIGGHHPRPHGA
ncbi:MAG: DUF378 domain-containing protein [Thermoleophilaceae bacterium]